MTHTVLAALQHKGAVAEGVALRAAVENFVLREPVAGDGFVVAADAAVIAVVFYASCFVWTLC